MGETMDDRMSGTEWKKKQSDAKTMVEVPEELYESWKQYCVQNLGVSTKGKYGGITILNSQVFSCAIDMVMRGEFPLKLKRKDKKEV